MQTKTVCQCVEFYYTFKKQIKMGRNGAPTYGPPDSPEKSAEAAPDIKVDFGVLTVAKNTGFRFNESVSLCLFRHNLSYAYS